MKKILLIMMFFLLAGASALLSQTVLEYHLCTPDLEPCSNYNNCVMKKEGDPCFWCDGRAAM